MLVRKAVMWTFSAESVFGNIMPLNLFWWIYLTPLIHLSRISGICWVWSFCWARGSPHKSTRSRPSSLKKRTREGAAWGSYNFNILFGHAGIDMALHLRGCSLLWVLLHARDFGVVEAILDIKESKTFWNEDRWEELRDRVIVRPLGVWFSFLIIQVIKLQEDTPSPLSNIYLIFLSLSIALRDIVNMLKTAGSPFNTTISLPTLNFITWLVLARTLISPIIHQNFPIHMAKHLSVVITPLCTLPSFKLFHFQDTLNPLVVDSRMPNFWTVDSNTKICVSRDSPLLSPYVVRYVLLVSWSSSWVRLNLALYWEKLLSIWVPRFRYISSLNLLIIWQFFLFLSKRLIFFPSAPVASHPLVVTIKTQPSLVYIVTPYQLTSWFLPRAWL